MSTDTDVDDSPHQWHVMAECTREAAVYRSGAVCGRAEGVVGVSSVDEPVDLIFMDIVMPGMNGYAGSTACSVRRGGGGKKKGGERLRSARTLAD